MKKIYFDVGANDGSSLYNQSVEGALVYAFEPTPRLLRDFLYPKSSDNFIVIPKAVSDFNGKTIFHIAGQHDWGCSSLNTFNDGLERTWLGRTDFKVTEDIEVEVITLESFIEENGIPYIDFLHVDTQGSDLAVLRGLGKYISIVKAGVIEVPANKEVALYKEQHTKEEAIDFLQKNNFKITKITEQQNEENVFFERL